MFKFENLFIFLMRKYYWMSKYYIIFYISFLKNDFFIDGIILFFLVNNDLYVGVFY